MQYMHTSQLYWLLMIGIILLVPFGVAAQVDDSTLPSTAVVDVPLGKCPRHFYLPMIPGVGTAHTQAAHAAASQVQPDAVQTAHYAPYLKIYLELYRQNRVLMHRVDTLAKGGN